MKGDEEQDEDVKNSYYKDDLFSEYKQLYDALSPKDKFEADVRRALSLINLCVKTESLSDELRSRFVSWFMEYGECKHVEEAFCRYLDQGIEHPVRISESVTRKAQ